MMASISAWAENLRAGPVVGVDIADEFVHLLELSGCGHRSRITASASAPLPGGMAEPRTLAAAIRKAIAAGGVRARRAVLALPASLLLIRRLQLPAGLGDDELDELLRADAERYLPYPLEQTCFDFEVLDAAGTEHTELRLFACARRDLEPRCEALRLAGLQVCGADVERYALETGAAALLRGAPLAAVLYFRRERSDLLLLERGETVYVQELPGSRSWLDDDGLPLCDRLPLIAEPIQQMLTATATAQTTARPELLLAGCSRQIDHLAQEISALLQLPCHAARPQANVDAAALLAYGLARRALVPRA